MFWRAGIILGLLLSLLAPVGCQTDAGDEKWPEGSKPKVLVSFPPLFSFAVNVAGDDAVVKSFLTTTGPHADSDPPANRIEMAIKADLFIVNGLALEGELPRKIGRKAGKQWQVVALGERIDKNELLEGVCHHEHAKNDPDHHHGPDPHIWLDARKAKVMVNAIRDELKRRDAGHAAGYDQRAAAYCQRLDQLHKEGEALFKDKKQKRFISFHDSLQYFAQCYGVQVADAIQVDPGVEPSLEKMKQIVQRGKKEKITVMAVEPQFPSTTSARAIRQALHDEGIEAVFAEIDPLETADAKDLGPELYEQRMRQNLQNLEKALQ